MADCFRLGWQRCFGGNCFGPRRIGAVHDYFDGGTARFEFDLFIDRIVFELCVESWWAGAREGLAIVKDLASTRRPRRAA